MTTKQQKIHNEQRYPGTGVDAADDNEVTTRLERQYTRDLNNNPRNTDM